MLDNEVLGVLLLTLVISVVVQIIVDFSYILVLREL